VSGFLTTPIITAGAIVLGIYIGLVILSDIWIKLKSYRYIVRFSLLVVCILVALPFWNILVDICDRDNLYKQPLQTGIAIIEITTEENGPYKSEWGEGYVKFIKEQKVLLMMPAQSDMIFRELGNNRRWYRATFELDILGKFIGKPIRYFNKTESAWINLSIILKKSKITGGTIKCTFNNSVCFQIPIPPQTMKDDIIIIPDVGKYFNKEY